MDTIFFKNKPKIYSTSTIAGPKECVSKVGKYIEKKLKNDMFEEKTYEKAECKMLSYVIKGCIKNADLTEKDVNLIIAGDLLNQIISSSFSARDFNVAFLGVYGACSTMAESIALASVLVDGGYYDRIISATGSHFSSAERQYRYPLELGCTRPPQAQWTVTGAGGCMIVNNALNNRANSPSVTCATFGKVVDYGVTDVNNLGAAMAPSCFSTIYNHLLDTNRSSDYYDLILTGDLGVLGSRILSDLLIEKGIDIRKKHVDCGEFIYNSDGKEFQGGSGAGCSAVVFNSYIINKLKNRKLNKVLFVATGALLSTVSSGQGESIPCVSHAVAIENDY